MCSLNCSYTAYPKIEKYIDLVDQFLFPPNSTMSNAAASQPHLFKNFNLFTLDLLIS